MSSNSVLYESAGLCWRRLLLTLVTWTQHKLEKIMIKQHRSKMQVLIEHVLPPSIHLFFRKRSFFNTCTHFEWNDNFGNHKVQRINVKVEEPKLRFKYDENVYV
jgi:hypothetical protein